VEREGFCGRRIKNVRLRRTFPFGFPFLFSLEAAIIALLPLSTNPIVMVVKWQARGKTGGQINTIMVLKVRFSLMFPSGGTKQNERGGILMLC